VIVLKIEYVNIEKLIPYVNNSRTHSEFQVKQIASSISEFGFTNPVLIDENQTIIAGHGRVMAAEILSIDRIPTIKLEGLTKAQIKAYVIADNKLALNADWNIDMLKLEFQDLLDINFNVDIIGFDSNEINALTQMPNFDPASEDDQGKLDQLDPKYISCPHCGKEFDMRGV
jgi:ParB-like chromosome segregation protein Spo0J